MKAGLLDRLITIERNGGAAENAFGEPIESWAALNTEFAQVIYGTGQERRQAGAEGADQAATFRVHANTSTLAVTTADRINFDGDIWDITSVAPLGRDGVEYTAVRRAS